MKAKQGKSYTAAKFRFLAVTRIEIDIVSLLYYLEFPGKFRALSFKSKGLIVFSDDFAMFLVYSNRRSMDFPLLRKGIFRSCCT